MTRHDEGARRFRVGSLFSGYGGLDMAVCKVFDATVAWHCEIDQAASRILAHHWDVPNLGDITAVDWHRVEPVDILAGGFPCQDLSAAGRRAGLRPGTRSGLWQHMTYAIAELRPQLVVIENVRGILSAPAHSDMEPCPWCLGDDGAQPAVRALGAVLGDLATLGYDARWCGVRASDVGAPHQRFRIFVVAADAERGGVQRRRGRRALVGAPRSDQGEGHQWQRDGDAAFGGGSAAADTVRDRWNPQFGFGGASCRSGPTSGFADQACAAADTAGDGRHEGRPEPARIVGRPDAAERGTGASTNTASPARKGTEPEHLGTRPQPAPEPPERAGSDIDWREYEPAIRRWEHILGRPAPTPHEPGPRGNPRLNPWFVEWLMGLPEGHVCSVPGISRNDALRALGNGVVPQQAELALRLMLADQEVAA